MASSPPTTSPDLAALREQRLRAHKEEVARLREEFGDPAEALNKLNLEVFTIEAFLPEHPAPDGEYRPIWEEDDD